jgi:hypothetical protein
LFPILLPIIESECETLPSGLLPGGWVYKLSGELRLTSLFLEFETEKWRWGHGIGLSMIISVRGVGIGADDMMQKASVLSRRVSHGALQYLLQSLIPYDNNKMPSLLHWISN